MLGRNTLPGDTATKPSEWLAAWFSLCMHTHICKTRALHKHCIWRQRGYDYGYSYCGVTDNKQKDGSSFVVREQKKRSDSEDKGGGSMYSYNTTSQTLQGEYLHSASNMQGGMQGRNTWIWVTQRYGCNKRVRLSILHTMYIKIANKPRERTSGPPNRMGKRDCVMVEKKRMGKLYWSLRKADMLT